MAIAEPRSQLDVRSARPLRRGPLRVWPVRFPQEDWRSRFARLSGKRQFRRHLALAVTASVLVHGVALGWLGRLPRLEQLLPFTVQAGRASIELQASMASVRNHPDAVDEVVEQIAELVRDIKPKPAEEAVEMADTEVRPAERQRSAAGVLHAPEGDGTAADLTARGSAAIARHEQADAQAKAPESPKLRRADVGARHLPDLVAGEVDSVAMAGSVAARGAEQGPPGIVANPAPVYPPAALLERRAGRVLLRVAVNAAGRVERLGVHQSSGHADLDQAAVETVRQWLFTPAAGSATREVLVPVRFVLDDS